MCTILVDPCAGSFGVNSKEAGMVRVERRRKTEERDDVGKAWGPDEVGLFRACAARNWGLLGSL